MMKPKSDFKEMANILDKMKTIRCVCTCIV